LPSRIAYFVSGHGYGHGLRSAQFINALPPSCAVTLYTTLPATFFHREITREYTYTHCQLDCGCVQRDALSVDISATYDAYAALESGKPALLDNLCALLSGDGTQFVIGDIPAIPFAAAARLDLPSMAISNFTWCDIYSEYCAADARFGPLLESMQSDYAGAHLYARLYPALSTSPIARVEDVDMLCRTNAVTSRSRLASRLGLDTDRRWCLVYAGEYGMRDIQWHRLDRYPDWQFVGLYPLRNPPGNYLQLPSGKLDYASLTAHSELVLGKLGYGLVSECLYRGTPVAYAARRDFCEYEVLVNALESHAMGYRLNADDMRNCELDNAIRWATTTGHRAHTKTAENRLLELVSLVYDA